MEGITQPTLLAQTIMNIKQIDVPIRSLSNSQITNPMASMEPTSHKFLENGATVLSGRLDQIIPEQNRLKSHRSPAQTIKNKIQTFGVGTSQNPGTAMFNQSHSPSAEKTSLGFNRNGY